MGRTEEQLATASLCVRGLLAFYGSTPAYRPVLDVEGWGDLQPELNALSKQGDMAGMIELVTDDMVDVLAVRGTPEDCAAELGGGSGTSRTGCAPTSRGTTSRWTTSPPSPRRCADRRGSGDELRDCLELREVAGGRDQLDLVGADVLEPAKTSRSSSTVPAKPVVGAIASTSEAGSQFM